MDDAGFKNDDVNPRNKRIIGGKITSELENPS